MPFQNKVRIPRSAVLRGENESVSPVSNVGFERIHILKRDGHITNCVRRLRRLNLAAPNGFTDAKQSSVWVNVTNAEPAQFSRRGCPRLEFVADGNPMAASIGVVNSLAGYRVN